MKQKRKLTFWFHILETDNSFSALIIDLERGDLGVVQMLIPGPFQPKDAGSSRTNMVVKILPTDSDNATGLWLWQTPILPIRINSSSSVGHTEYFTPYPLKLSYIPYSPCTNCTLHPCYRCNSLHSPHCFMPLGPYSDCSLYVPSLSSWPAFVCLTSSHLYCKAQLEHFLCKIFPISFRVSLPLLFHSVPCMYLS